MARSRRGEEGSETRSLKLSLPDRASYASADGVFGKDKCFWHRNHTVIGMLTLLSALGSLLSFRVRSRGSLELELVALRHQVTVLRRQRPGQPRLFAADRLLWVWLYRLWPQVLDAMVLVKPATVVQWHRKGFRLYWRRRSRRVGRPGI